MEWIKVRSKLISEIAYDEAGHELHIRFQSRAEKVFPNIPKHMFENLLTAESPGFYYATYISEHASAR